MDDRKIGIAIPTYNRFEMTLESFLNVNDDDRVEHIVVCDDVSTDGSFEKLSVEFKNANKYPKVDLYKNEVNLDCYANKMTSMELLDTYWGIILDSDNIINKSYLDVIYSIQDWDKKTSYMPSFAMPHFDYRQYEGIVLSKENIAEYIDKPMISTCLNCMNFFINVDEYLKTWSDEIDPITADSIFFNYLWFKRGNKMMIVPGLNYEHRVHGGSHYQNNVHRTGNLSGQIINKIKRGEW